MIIVLVALIFVFLLLSMALLPIGKARTRSHGQVTPPPDRDR
jgi:hypothetical protein